MADGVSIALLSGGTLFGYAAITGKSPLQAFFYAVLGKDPRSAAVTQSLPQVSTDPGTVGIASGTGGGAGVVAAAEAQIGKPYIWASPSNPDDPNPKGFDCSGLAQWCWKKAGATLKNHNAAAQRNTNRSKLVPLASLQPGGLVFFGSDHAPHHVGIYVGNNEMINAPDFGIPVRRQSVKANDLLPTGLPFPVQVNAPAAAGSSGGVGGTLSAPLAKARGQQLAATYGWGSGANWDALDKLWTRESSWNPAAKNPSSGAYGIPQALPASKLPKAGQSPTNSVDAQVGWGLRYIKQRYGSPVVAWAHEQQHGWY